ncbi:unannotated protein [freshwater metagenome]|uniref:Unannotated protein n=1 Tax=freshwater metagenome TaxID=449393 RepID=A0A6J7TFK5_9ZZZZ
MIARKTNGGTKAIAAAKSMETKKPMMLTLYGRANCQTRASDERSILRPFTAVESLGIIM